MVNGRYIMKCWKCLKGELQSVDFGKLCIKTYYCEQCGHNVSLDLTKLDINYDTKLLTSADKYGILFGLTDFTNIRRLK